MSQVSYGTITITDTTDIERIYLIYKGSSDNINAPSITWSDATHNDWQTDITLVEGKYIWAITVFKKSGITITSSNYSEYYSDPVCLTGEEGTDGRGITSITIKYGTSADWNTQPSNWYDNTPEYSSSTPNYWTQTTISYTTGNPTVKVTQDKALTQAIQDSVVANSLAQSANENANGAMGQAASNVNSIVRLWRAKSERSIPSAPTSEITTGSTSEYTNWSTIKPTATDTYRYFYYCDQSKTGGGVCTWSEVIEDTSYLSTYEINSLNVRTKNFFKGLDNSYDGWFASGRAENEGLATNNAETYHYNARVAATHIALGYNKTPIIDLDGGSGAINIYRFPTINSDTGLVTTAGALGMKLSATDLIFYKPPVGNNDPVAAATLNANGLVLSEGGIVAGTKGQTGYIYLSTINHPVGTNGVTINGFTPTSSTEQWREVIGTKFGVTNAGTLYANNAVISGTITVGSGSTIDSGATIGGTSASTVVTNASTGASAATDLATYKTTVADTYATKEALSDVEDQIPDVSGLASKNVAIAEEQLIYIQATSGTNSVSAYPSSSTTTSSYWVTQTGESIPNGTPPDSATGQTPRWTTKRPSYQKNYPVIFVAKQKKTVSGAITCTTPIKDDTTTIIDGGHITTGTIDASRLSVYDATINKISASAIDVGSIQIGQNQVTNLTTTLSDKASINAEYEVVIKVSSIDYANSSATLIAIPTKLGESTTGSFVWYKNAINTAHGGTVSTTTNTDDTLTVSDLEALYIAVLQ